MIGWRFAFTRRWAGYLALTVVFAIVCVSLGVLAARAPRRGRVPRSTGSRRNWDAAPVPIDDVLPDARRLRRGRQVDAGRTQPAATCVDEQLLVRNRPLNGTRASRCSCRSSSPTAPSSSSIAAGCPTGNEQDAPDDVPAPPAGEVTVVARLKAGEPTVLGRPRQRARSPPIDLPEIAALLDEPMYTGAYGLLVERGSGGRRARPRRPSRIPTRARISRTRSSGSCSRSSASSASGSRCGRSTARSTPTRQRAGARAAERRSAPAKHVDAERGRARATPADARARRLAIAAVATTHQIRPGR